MALWLCERRLMSYDSAANEKLFCTYSKQKDPHHSNRECCQYASVDLPVSDILFWKQIKHGNDDLFWKAEKSAFWLSDMIYFFYIYKNGSERDPHLIPCVSSMNGIGYSFIDKTDRCIVMYFFFQACQNNETLASQYFFNWNSIDIHVLQEDIEYKYA